MPANAATLYARNGDIYHLRKGLFPCYTAIRRRLKIVMRILDRRGNIKMKKQWSVITITAATAAIAVLVLLGLMGDTGSSISTPALAAPLSLTVTAVDPAVAPNDLDTSIIISGTGFTAVPTVTLDSTVLDNIGWVSAEQVTATVPWGLEPGVYALTVVNPDGISDTLPNAFTVAEGLGQSDTGGPYGGMSVQLALKPDDSSTIYATMFGVGLFTSEDAAGSWEPIHDHDWPVHLDFDSQNPDVLYYGADSCDLYRSKDNGTSWERISDGFHTQNGCFRTYPIAHPAQAGVVYFGMGGCADIYLMPGEGGVFYSTDYGDTWNARNTDLSDLDVQSLAIHPNNPNTLLAGTQDGNLFYSVNGGLNWTWTTQLTGTVTSLYFNPYETLQAWAATDAENEGRGYLYRSINLVDWDALDVSLQPQGGSAHVQMTFLPGSIWLASQSVYSSTNSGASWTPLNGSYQNATAIAISPDKPQEITIGTDYGIEKSIDGGTNWREVTDGLAALVPSAVAVSPDDPDTVYVKTHRSIFVSHNGGNEWQSLDYGGGGFPGGNLLAVDKFVGTRLYLSSGCPDQFCIDISPDGGETWNLATAPLPSAYAGWTSDSFAITPSPHTPGRVLVGASLSPPGGGDYVGVFYRSDDYGESWTTIEPPQPIKRISELAYDAFNSNLIYAATAKSGFWRSTNGGDNWEQLQVPNVQPPVVIADIAVHPNVPDKVTIRTYSFAVSPNPEPELWVSEDAGISWEALTYVFSGVDLLVAPPLPEQLSYSLYTGCVEGLCRSEDDGATWASIEGTPRPEILTAASDGERSVIYMGTPGGLVNPTGVQTTLLRDTIPGRGSVYGGGIYRLTTRLPTDWVYLPIVPRE